MIGEEAVLGEQVAATQFSRADRTEYRQKVRRCLDVFERMLRESAFDFDKPMTGLEIELNLVDDHGDPTMRNAEVLTAIADPDFQTELGQFNIEINVPPLELAGTSLADLEQTLRNDLNHAEVSAQGVHARTMMIGILPTLMADHLSVDALTTNPRYKLLNEQIFAARGEDMWLDIEGSGRGGEQLRTSSDSIAPEAACTSVQCHLQVSPDTFSAYWNAAQSIAGVQMAIGANSPFLFGKQLWRETRIALFDQATDTRSEELKEQGVRPRVWFGERWITSVFDLLEENVRYFPALLPICSEEDPLAVLEAGGVPALSELRLHNGTVYRWNRPIYDVVGDLPHLRVENRVLPAGPTVVDTLANAALYYGLVRVLAEDDRPVWSRMSFSVAEENFHTGAKLGIEARTFWPGLGEVPTAELVLRRLLPMAADGLGRWGVDSAVSDRLLGILEQRCLTHRNGAEWQVETVRKLQDEQNLSRPDALRRMALSYAEHMHSNEPVHTWPLG
jgi:hypothetical protein